MSAFHIYTPAAPLSRYVESFWIHEEGAQPYARERSLPTGRPALWIDLGGDGLGVADQRDPRHMRIFCDSVLLGAQASWFYVEAGRHVSRMGVTFKFGGASPFFAQPSSELHGVQAPLAALWGGRAEGELRERLFAETAPRARFQVLERALLAQMRATYTRHPAVAFALGAFLAEPQPQTITQVARQSGLSHRQFISVFRRDVGMSPKQFCRLRRFLEAL